jgi:hypothetical protein
MMPIMNSSISSSDINPEARSWRHFTATLVTAAAVALTGLVALAYAVDPYDTGRSELFAKPGVRPQGPRTANPSRGRDPAFNAMIVGNSRIQIVSPEQLKKTTGLDFVQLSVPGSGPQEHLTLIEWFLRHRKETPKALIVSVDDLWCTSDPALPNDKPFPFWLYSRNTLEYSRGLLRYDVLEELPRRFAYLFGKPSERARPDGYWDYEPEYLALGTMTNLAARQRLQQKPYANAQRFERDPKEGGRVFPAAERLGAVATSLPVETALILVHPPAHINSLPPNGTERDFILQACKAAIASAARAAHARTAVVDWQTERPEIARPELFFDPLHYRQPLARMIEADIAKALKSFP